MPLNIFRHYLGPIGNMQALPPLTKGSNPGSTAVLIGAQHVTLSGRTTIDIAGWKRQFPLSFSFRSEDELQSLQAAFRRISSGPFGSVRLILPRRRNCLSAQLSSGGSERQDTSGFTASAGALAFGIQSGLPGTVANLLGGQVWTSTAAAQTLLSSPTTVPIVPGASYLFSAWAAGTGTYTPTIQPYDVTGAALSAVTGTNLVLAASPAWGRGVVGRYNPTPTAASFAVGWTATGAGTCNTTGWQVDTDPATPSPTAFVLGVGAPAVYVASMSEIYPYRTFFNSDVLLQEV